MPQRGGGVAFARRTQAAADDHRPAVWNRTGLGMARPCWPERLRARRGQLYEKSYRGPHRNHDLRDTRADWSEAFELVPVCNRICLARFLFTREVLNGCSGSASCIRNKSFGMKAARCSPGRTTGISTSLAGTCGRRTRPGSGKPARIRRFGIHLRRNSSWADRTKKIRPPNTKCPATALRRATTSGSAAKTQRHHVLSLVSKRHKVSNTGCQPKGPQI